MMQPSLPACTSHLPSAWLFLYLTHKPGGGVANTVAHTRGETGCIWRLRVEARRSPRIHSQLYRANLQLLACQEESKYQLINI